MSISVALKQAKKSSFRFQLGAVITKGGSVLGIGHNEICYDKLNPHPYPTLHAEVAACLQVLKRGDAMRLRGATIYVARIGAKGARLARPCGHCLAFLKDVGITKLVYTTNEGTIKNEKI